MVPNHQCSICTRLWCVYEAFVAISMVGEKEMDIHIPWFPRSWALRRTMGFAFISLIVGALAGALVGRFVTQCFLSIGPVTRIGLMYCFWSVLRIAVQKMEGRRITEEKAFLNQTTGAHCRFLVLFECMGVFLFAHVAGHALVMLFKQMCKEMHPIEDGEGLSVSLAIFTFTVSFFAKMYTVVKVYLAATEENMLQFSSVAEARCSCTEDKEHITEQIMGREGQIDVTIKVLAKLGRYNPRVSGKVFLGMSFRMARRGVNVGRAICALMSFSFWLLTNIACGIRSVRSDPEQFIVFLVVMFAPMLCVVCLNSIFKESSIWAINAGFYSGLLFLVCSQFCFPAANCHNFVRTSPAFVLSVLSSWSWRMCFLRRL